MKVNEKFPNWMTSGGNTPDSFTGFISNVVYPYFYAQDKPTFRYSYSTNVFPSITVGTAAQWLSSLDVMFAMRFGERTLRKIVEPFKLHNDSTKSVTSENIAHTNILAQMINERFADKWNHIADALAIEYSPLENYDRTEESSFSHDEKGNDYNTTRHGYSLSGTGESNDPITEKKDDEIDNKAIKGGWADNDTRTTTTTGQYSKLTTNKDSIHGFNGKADFDKPGAPSEYSQSSEKFDYSPTGSDVKPYAEANTGALTRDYHGIANDKANPHYNEDYEKKGSEYTKEHTNHTNGGWDHSYIHGNIGVTSSQQMLTQELEVRRNILYDIILNDIAEFLTISIY